MTAAGGVHHLAVLVRDLSRVEPFYRDVLGLPVLRRWPADAAQAADGDRSVWLDAGGGAFLALERAYGAAAAQVGALPPGDAAGLHMVALRIAPADRAAWEQRLAAAGFPVFNRTAFTLYVRDPEGNRVGLSHWPDEAG